MEEPRLLSLNNNPAEKDRFLQPVFFILMQSILTKYPVYKSLDVL